MGTIYFPARGHGASSREFHQARLGTARPGTRQEALDITPNKKNMHMREGYNSALTSWLKRMAHDLLAKALIERLN